ncbi:MAG: heme exporter protein CcmD [Pigmentiphaga sp.]
MNWTSPSEFFAMGGYGTYVWGSLSVTVAVLFVEFVLLAKRRRAALVRIKYNTTLRREVGK